MAAVSPASAAVVSLGAATSFAVLAGQTVTNTGTSVINGDVGVWPGSAITGFPPGIVNGTVHAGTGPAQTAQTSVTSAFNSLANLPCGTTITGSDLGSLGPLDPGVYCFASGAQLTGTLTLNEHGLDDQAFVFLIGSTLLTASDSVVTEINTGPGGAGVNDNIFWKVGSSATLGTNTDFLGNILALTSITLNTGASISCGRALARNGSVTLDDNDISACPTSTAVPEPSTLMALLTALLVLGGIGWRRSPVA
ncbi:MAG: ice-binding family protein [Acetobacteraceae bacterium]